jgi:hypothetical protein
MPAPADENELVQKASFVFRGTVQRLNAATLPEIGDTSKTAIVRVDETLQSPKVLSHYTGQQITVQSPTPLREGEKAVFYTNAWLFGNSGPAVKSIGHVDAADTITATMLASPDPVLNLETRRARNLFDSSEMVVRGTVTKVEMAGPRTAINTREHDPDWRVATIHVSEAHKGGVVGSDVLVRFPASYDRAWHNVPKLKAGDHGLFMLHKVGEGSDDLVLKHPEDFEPESSPGAMNRLVRAMEVQ